MALLTLSKAAVRAAEKGSFVPRLSGQTSLAPLGIWLRLFSTGRGVSRRRPLKDVNQLGSCNVRTQQSFLFCVSCAITRKNPTFPNTQRADWQLRMSGPCIP